MLRRLPRDLPLFGASLLGLSLIAWGYAGMYTEFAIGRPSSTASLGFLFVPIWGVLAAVVGLVLGFIVRAVWRRAKGSTEPEQRSWALLATLGFAIVASAGAGALSVIQYEQEAKPQIRLDSGLLVREFRNDSEKTIRPPTALYDSDRKSAAVSWASNRSELLFGDDRVVFRDTMTGKHAEFRTPALDYITRVDAVPMSATPGRALLAIVISGRATGRRAIIAVIDENYKVIFEEQVQRFWELKDTPVEIRVRSSAKDEYVVVGPRCNESLILRRKDAA
ncbi:MAG TPA: hypothetical protein VFZ71_08120 [Pyrinomonadaceae bacterium]